MDRLFSIVGIIHVHGNRHLLASFPDFLTGNDAGDVHGNMMLYRNLYSKVT